MNLATSAKSGKPRLEKNNMPELVAEIEKTMKDLDNDGSLGTRPDLGSRPLLIIFIQEGRPVLPYDCSLFKNKKIANSNL